VVCQAALQLLRKVGPCINGKGIIVNVTRCSVDSLNVFLRPLNKDLDYYIRKQGTIVRAFKILAMTGDTVRTVTPLSRAQTCRIRSPVFVAHKQIRVRDDRVFRLRSMTFFLLC
jgi:hypothetical protein